MFPIRFKDRSKPWKCFSLFLPLRLPHGLRVPTGSTIHHCTSCRPFNVETNQNMFKLIKNSENVYNHEQSVFIFQPQDFFVYLEILFFSTNKEPAWFLFLQERLFGKNDFNQLIVQISKLCSRAFVLLEMHSILGSFSQIWTAILRWM